MSLSVHENMTNKPANLISLRYTLWPCLMIDSWKYQERIGSCFSPLYLTLKWESYI